MSKKFYLALYILSVIFAIFVLVGGKSKTFGRSFLDIHDKNGIFYGDLYAMSEIDAFRLPISGVSSDEKDTIENTKIITMGDSFFQSRYESKILADELEDNIKMPIYGVPINIDSPLDYLKRIKYKRGDKKYIIVESVERTAVKRGLAYANDTKTVPVVSAWKQVANDIDYAIFDMTDVDYFFKHNIFINPLRIILKNLNYKLLGRMDSRIGSFSMQPLMLFYFEEVDFDKNIQNTELVPKVVDGIKKLSETLKQNYNLEMIYVVIPNKYTIYNDLDKQGSYNGFIPRLQVGLKDRGVNYVDLYSSYMANRKNNQLLYYPNDSHFTPWGKKILVDLLSKKIIQSEKTLP